MTDDTLLAELAGALKRAKRFLQQRMFSGIGGEYRDYENEIGAINAALSRYEERQREAIRNGVG